MSYKSTTCKNTALYLFTPTYEKINGVTVKKFPEKGVLFFASFKSYGGTETTVNGLLSIEDTAEIEMFYRPDIKSDCVVQNEITGERYEILNEPENVNMANQILKFKVRRIKGGA